MRLVRLSAIVAVFAVNWEALCKEYAIDDDGGPSDTARALGPARRLRPGASDWLFDYVAVILYNTNRMFNSLWSESLVSRYH